MPLASWTPQSWTEKPASHQTTYDDDADVARVVKRLSALPPLVTSWEIERLRAMLAEAQEGRRFVLQGGDCAETLADCTPQVITNKLKILLQMSLVLVHGAKKPVVRIGRFAGQYAKPRSSQTEIDACGQCHARASRLTGDRVHGSSLLDTHRPSLLDPTDFHPDGQMLGEVFNWAPFLQSRMAEAGVTCSDCHQPHSLKLRAPGNAVCAQCHLPARFDTEAHSHHPPGSEGSQCTACHMPQVTFMEIDARHDHAFRIPRPDLSISHGVANACTDCHSAERRRDSAA